MENISNKYVFVDDLKLTEGDAVTFLHRFTDDEGKEWEEEEKCILAYYIDDNKINLKRSNNKYVWVTKADIVGKMRQPFFSESKIKSITSQINNIQNSINTLEKENEVIEDTRKKNKNNKQIEKLNVKKSSLEQTLKAGTECTQVWITGYEPIEGEE